MKKFFFLALLVFFGALTATAKVVIDSIQKSTTSVKVFCSWNFNSPDTTGYVGVQLATNAGFTAGVVTMPLAYRSVDTGNFNFTFSGLTPNTNYYIRTTELVPPTTQWYGTGQMVKTDQTYYLPQVVIDSISSTWNSQEIFYRYKTGNDTLRIAIRSAKNPTFTVGLNIMPDFTTPVFPDTAWVSASSLISDLQDSTLYYNEVSVSNRKGTVKSVASEYTLARPINTPFASSDSSTTTYTSGTIYGSGWGNQGYGFKVYASQADALNDNNGANYVGSGSIGYFFKTISGLNSSTTKWWRSYAVYNGTTVWGTVKSFTTKVVPLPTISPTIVPTGPTTASGSVSVNTNGLPATVTFEYVNGTITLSSGVPINGPLPVSMTDLTPDAVNQYIVTVIIYGDTSLIGVFWVQTDPEPHVLDARVTDVTLNTATDKLDVTFRYVSENELATLWIEITDDISGIPVVKWNSGYLSFSTLDDTWQYVTVPVSRADGWKNHPGTYYARVKGYNSNNSIETQWTSVVVVSVIQRSNQKEFFRINDTPIFLDNSINDEVILDMYSTNGQQLLSGKVRESSNTILDFPSGIYIYRITDKNGVFIESGKFLVK
jgi:hypothetical protein